MLFDFDKHIQALRENADKKEEIEKHERYCGKITGNIKDQDWYINYVSKFQAVKYEVPEELKDDFDWDLLLQLSCASFSSDPSLDKKNEKTICRINVKSGEQNVEKFLSELWGFQILRLYEIYIEEQINLTTLIAEDDTEKEDERSRNEKHAIIAQRQSRLNRWSLILQEYNESTIIDGSLDDLENLLNNI